MILALALLAQPAIAPAATTERRIEVAPGRSLLLRCAGSGPATALFDAGGSDWSLVWTGVQQQLARSVQACAYDRAGLGQSDAAPGPRTPSAIASDLHALIGKAGFNRPVVLVGHSLGGFNVKLTAALYPNDVAGLVLLDPSEDRTWERSRQTLGARYGVRNTAQAELADPPSSPLWSTSTAPAPSAPRPAASIQKRPTFAAAPIRIDRR